MAEVNKKEKSKKVSKPPVQKNIQEEVVEVDLNVEEIQEDPVEAVKPKQKISVVIPYFEEKAQGDELKYALRSIQKNFKEDFQIVIVGDKPEWLSDEAIHIDAQNISENARVDTLNKIKLAVADPDVSERFIMSYDDIYFVGPVMLADIEFLVAYGMLEPFQSTPYHFQKDKNRTIDTLVKNGLKTYNYDTHTPYLFEKEKITEILEVFPEFHEGDDNLLLSSIYLNYHFPEFVPHMIDNLRSNYLLRLITNNPSKDAFDKYIQGKKFLNNATSGYSNLLVDYLSKTFPEKSIFEK